MWKLFLTGIELGAGSQNSFKQQVSESTGMAISCCVFDKSSSFYETHYGEPDSLLSSVCVFVHHKISHRCFEFAFSQDSYQSHSFRLLSGISDMLRWDPLNKVVRKGLVSQTTW